MVWVLIMRLWTEGLRGVPNLLSILGGISLDTKISGISRYWDQESTREEHGFQVYGVVSEDWTEMDWIWI